MLAQAAGLVAATDCRWPTNQATFSPHTIAAAWLLVSYRAANRVRLWPPSPIGLI